jgi:hypothetical protein
MNKGHCRDFVYRLECCKIQKQEDQQQCKQCEPENAKEEEPYDSWRVQSISMPMERPSPGIRAEDRTETLIFSRTGAASLFSKGWTSFTEDLGSVVFFLCALIFSRAAAILQC